MKRIIAFLFVVTLSLSSAIFSSTAIDSEKKSNDIKKYPDLTSNRDFEMDSILIVMNRNNSKINKRFTSKNFKEIESSEVQDLTQLTGDIENKNYVDYENFKQILLITLKKANKSEVIKAIKLLEKREDIEYVGPNYIIQMDGSNDSSELNNAPIGSESDDVLPCFDPNDTRYPDQYALPLIGAKNAWNITRGSSTVNIGVIDTGIDRNHEDLSENMSTILGYDFADNDNDPSDVNGHGTHVAGIIGAVGNNKKGISGVCQTIKLVALKIYRNSGSGNTGFAVQAINYAKNNNIQILNYSNSNIRIDPITNQYYDDNGYNGALDTAIGGYTGLFVAAAGNVKQPYDLDRDNDIRPTYPASHTHNNIIAVANSTSTDSLSSGSHYGATSVDLAAPGTSILSTLPENSYGTMSGTSMAAPHVTGVAALIKSARHDLTALQIKDCILRGVDDINLPSNTPVLTDGRLNAKKALDRAVAMPLNEFYSVGGDFNGDGTDEVAVMRTRDLNGAELLVGNPHSRREVYQLARWWWWDSGFPLDKVNGRIVSGNFGGDSKDDVAVVFDSTSNYESSSGAFSLHVFISTGSSFQHFHMLEVPSAFNLQQVQGRAVSGRFYNDADAFDEIALIYDCTSSHTGSSGGMAVYLLKSNGNAFSLNWSPWYHFETGFNLARVKNRIEAGEYSNDFLDDLAIVYDSTASYPGSTGAVSIYVLKSTGGAFNFDWSPWFNMQTGFNLNNVENRVAAGRYSHASRSDLAMLYNQSSGSTSACSMFVFKSTGTAFSFSWTPWAVHSSGYNPQTVCSLMPSGDFDNNQYDDIVNVYTNAINQTDRIYIFSRDDSIERFNFIW